MATRSSFEREFEERVRQCCPEVPDRLRPHLSKLAAKQHELHGSGFDPEPEGLPKLPKLGSWTCSSGEVVVGGAAVEQLNIEFAREVMRRASAVEEALAAIESDPLPEGFDLWDVAAILRGTKRPAERAEPEPPPAPEPLIEVYPPAGGRRRWHAASGKGECRVVAPGDTRAEAIERVADDLGLVREKGGAQ